MKKKKALLSVYIILSGLLSFVSARAAGEYIEVRGTDARQGTALTVPVFARLDSFISVPDPGSLRIFFTYNPNRLRFDTAIGNISGGTILRCNNPEVRQNIVRDSVTALLEIACPEISRFGDSVLLYLQFTTLGGRDTVAMISPDSIFINERKETGIALTPGNIRFPFDRPVVQNFPEGLGPNRPNPFYVNTVFSYSITRPTNVRFSVFNVLGREVFSRDFSNVGQGFYELDIRPVVYEWANGTYYIVMKTDEAVYQGTFLYLK